MSERVDGSSPRMADVKAENYTEAHSQPGDGYNKATNYGTVDDSFGKPDSRLNRSQRPNYIDSTTPIEESRSETEASQFDGPIFLKDKYGNITQANLMTSNNNMLSVLKSGNMTTNVFNMQANIGDKPTVGGTVEPKQHNMPKVMPGGIGGDHFSSVMQI